MPSKKENSYDYHGKSQYRPSTYIAYNKGKHGDYKGRNKVYQKGSAYTDYKDEAALLQAGVLKLRDYEEGDAYVPYKTDKYHDHRGKRSGGVGKWRVE